MRRWLVLLAAAAALGIGLASAQFWIALFIYRPAAMTGLDLRSSASGGAVPMSVSHPDGSSITGWWRPPPSAVDPVVLIVHGRSANIAARAPIMRRLAADGFGVLLFDYRGYGASAGRPSERALAEDTLTAYRWLRDRGIAPWRIVVVGQSLGASPAAGLASREPIGALILVSPFTDLPGALADRLPWLPLELAPWTRNRFDLKQSLLRFQGPTLLVASDEDGLVPIQNARRLRDVSPHAQWLDATPLRHDGMLAAITADGRLTKAIRRLAPAGAARPHENGRPQLDRAPKAQLEVE